MKEKGTVKSFFRFVRFMKAEEIKLSVRGGKYCLIDRYGRTVAFTGKSFKGALRRLKKFLKSSTLYGLTPKGKGTAKF